MTCIPRIFPSTPSTRREVQPVAAATPALDLSFEQDAGDNGNNGDNPTRLLPPPVALVLPLVIFQPGWAARFGGVGGE